MEFDLDTLRAMLDRASLTSDLKSLEGHILVLYVNSLRDSVQIRVEDADSCETVLTISIPAKIKTTFSL